MRWSDLLRMSVSSLRRRKLRTFLTVLGVVIGTASIVVMISLGLGMQQFLYREIEQSGGMTSITVTGKDVGSRMVYTSDDQMGDETKKYITDETIKELEKIRTCGKRESVAYDEFRCCCPENMRDISSWSG